MNNDKKAYLLIGVLSGLVLTFLTWLIYFKEAAAPSGEWTTNLPALNAILNTLTATLLIFGIRMIRIGQKKSHIRCMLGATLSSALFLVSYILYHHFHGDTKFMGEGLVRYVYFFILISHILLSIVQVPLIFTTLYHAFRKNHSAHKKVARITFPIWLYVSVTGILIFVFLKLN